MIGHLKGHLIDKSPTRILLDVHGVGYDINIPFTTFEKLGAVGDEAALLTHLYVREDALTLFGFATAAEKKLFLLLLSVSGIGPKIAQAILSGSSVEAFSRHVRNGEIASLTAIPGVGKKTAERIVLELKDKMAALEEEMKFPSGAVGILSIHEQALQALISLGYARPAAQKAVDGAVQQNPQASLEEIIKHALRNV
jgi:Holliday junction DNA helicase RuvA